MKVREYFGCWPLTNTLFETGSLFLEIVFLLSVEYSAHDSQKGDLDPSGAGVACSCESPDVGSRMVLRSAARTVFTVNH